jgi:signal peptidase I
MLKRFGSLAEALVILAFLVVSVGSVVSSRPFLGTVVKSNSMEPVYYRGDVVLLWNWPGDLAPGDVILFRPGEGALTGQWTLHRIVGIDENTGGFLTKGDAADATDQADRLAGPVSAGQIVAKALFIGRIPVKIPGIGHIALRLAEGGNRQSLQQRVLLPVLVVTVAMLLREIWRPARRRKNRGLDPRIILLSVSFMLTMMLVTMTFLQSVRAWLVYGVADEQAAVLGQPMGILKLGDVVCRPLASVQNKGFLPMIVLLTENDPNVACDCAIEWLQPGETREISFELHADTAGSFRTPVTVSLVFPLLPPALIQHISRVNHWLGALLGCALPGSLLATAGLLEPTSRMRTARDLRKWRRRVLATPMRVLRGRV